MRKLKSTFVPPACPLLSCVLFVILIVAVGAPAQTHTSGPNRALEDVNVLHAQQTALILGLDGPIQMVRMLRSQRPRGSSPTAEELSARQDLLEMIQASVLDVEAVLAEVSNERQELGELRTTLHNRRDKTVGRLNAAALIAGSGLGAAISATQFSSLGTRAQNIGDGIGIGSAVAATVLSVVAVRRQRGPTASAGDVPNMLAPLLGGTPVLSAHYPEEILAFLGSVPAGEDPIRGTRLEQLKANWYKTARLNKSYTLERIGPLISSRNSPVKVTISDLDDRIAMLGDVGGRVALVKRDLAILMRSYLNSSAE